jgi:nicotinamidase-related amidase
MDRTGLLEQLKRALVVAVERPPLPEGNVGLIIVDVVQGFTRSGTLSDPSSMTPMVDELDHFVRELDEQLGRRLRLLVLRDCHHPDIPEPPYPPHCIVNSGEEQLDPELAWLEDHPRCTMVDKDCINGFVGAMRPSAGGLFRNLLVDWVLEHKLATLVVAGDCTDICVSDLTVALLSARNHGLLTRVSPERRSGYVQAITSMGIYVYVPGCATYDLDPETLPADNLTLRHPGPIAHHVGLWLMASRGARLIDGFTPLRQDGFSD